MTGRSVAPAWCGDFLKIPYRDMGRDRSGVDCYGLVVLVHRERYGRELPDYAYGSARDGNVVAGTITTFLPQHWRRVEQPQEGDLVLLQLAGVQRHCGVWVAPNLMMHAIDDNPSSVERLDSPRWARRVTGFHRPVAA